MREIPLTQGRIAIVDGEDFERFGYLHYYYHQKGYALRWVGSKYRPKEIYLHQDIMGTPPPDMVIDHINRNRLDNRRCNLRFVTRAQNRVNSRKTRYGSYSQYRGAHYHIRLRKWAASIGVNGKLIHLGYFSTEREAALAYNKAATEYHGEYANLNKI